MIMDVRRVIFSLIGPQDFGFDPEQSEEEINQSNERKRKREGIFHGWHDIEVKSTSSDNYLIKKVALIEDAATGRINEVFHENFQFVINNNFL